MKIPVHRLIHLDDQTIQIKDTFHLSQLTERNSRLIHLDPVHIDGMGYIESGLFVIKGNISGTYTLLCSRCLSPLKRAFTESMVERFDLHPEENRFADDNDDEQEIHTVTGMELDLTPIVEEHVLLSIPQVPVCDEEEACRARMVTEGKDWTLVDSEKRSEKVDPRLAKLARLIDKQEK